MTNIFDLRNKSQLADMAKQFVHPFGSKIGVIGDSLSSIGTNEGWFAYNWVSGSVYESGKGIIVAPGGISGNTTTQMLSRIDTDIIAKNPHICFILGGTNDDGSNIDLTEANIDAMIIKLLNSKIIPVLCTNPPRNPGSTTSIKTISVNDRIKKLAYKYNLKVIDFYDLLVDSTTGGYISTYTTDGIHPNTAGNKLMSNYVVSNFWNFMQQGYIPLYGTNVYTTNLLSNALFITDTNADGVPDSWTKSTDGVYSLVDDTNIKGKWLKLAKNNAGTVRVYQTVSSGFSVGDVLNISGLVKTEGIEAAGTTNYSVRLFFSGNAVEFYPIQEWSVDLTNQAKLSYNFIVPSGTTAINLQLYVGGTGLSGSASFAQFSLKNLTTSKAI